MASPRTPNLHNLLPAFPSRRPSCCTRATNHIRCSLFVPHSAASMCFRSYLPGWTRISRTSWICWRCPLATQRCGVPCCCARRSTRSRVISHQSCRYPFAGCAMAEQPAERRTSHVPLRTPAPHRQSHNLLPVQASPSNPPTRHLNASSTLGNLEVQCTVCYRCILEACCLPFHHKAYCVHTHVYTNTQNR